MTLHRTRAEGSLILAPYNVALTLTNADRGNCTHSSSPAFAA